MPTLGNEARGILGTAIPNKNFVIKPMDDTYSINNVSGIELGGSLQLVLLKCNSISLSRPIVTGSVAVADTRYVPLFWKGRLLCFGRVG